MADYLFETVLRRGRSAARLARLLFFALITVLVAAVVHGVRRLS